MTCWQWKNIIHFVSHMESREPLTKHLMNISPSYSLSFFNIYMWDRGIFFEFYYHRSLFLGNNKRFSLQSCCLKGCMAYYKKCFSKLRTGNFCVKAATIVLSDVFPN